MTRLLPRAEGTAAACKARGAGGLGPATLPHTIPSQCVVASQGPSKTQLPISK